MKKLLIFIVLVLSTASLYTCTQKSYLEITQTNFEEEVILQENLKFTFNKSLVGDTLLNVWDTTTYIDFEPKVPGKFKWVSPYEVVFSPLAGFMPSTDYEAKLNRNFNRFLSGDLTLKQDEVIKFHTPYLNLEETHIFWSQDDRRTNQLRINLNFNYKVYPRSLQELVSAKADGEAIPTLRVLNSEPSKTVELVIEEIGSLDLDNKTLEVEVAPGIECAESDFITKKVITFSKNTPNKNRLKIENISTEFNDLKAQVRVKTNQSVSLVQVLNNLRVSPRIVYEVQILEDGFLIKGNFKSGNSYTIRIDDKMQGIFGASLGSDYQERITFGEMKPYISFVSKKGIYLSNKGNKNVGIRINNVPQIKVSVHQIYENNLIHFVKRNRYNFEYENYYLQNLDAFGDVILEQNYDTKVLPLVDDYRVLHVDFSKINKKKGIYVVQVSSSEDQWLRSTKIISISDIGFIARETKEDILVFTNSLLNAQAMRGVMVNVLSKSNQVIGQASTNQAGVAVFSGIKKKYPDANISMITAQSGEDFNYLFFDQSRVDKSPFETGGLRPHESGYQAFLYGERDLYRPGETIHLNVVVRDRTWKPLSKIPIKFRLKLPNGKDLHVVRGTLNEQGSYNLSLPLSSSALTGTYYAEVYTSTDALLTSMPISVEEFMPDRIKVNLRLVEANRKTTFKGGYQSEDSVRVSLTATNLFGPPAANRNYELSFSLRSTEFSPKAFRNYDFQVQTSSQERREVYRYDLDSKGAEGKTNAKGLAYHSFKIEKEFSNLGKLRGQIYATVFDETGRPVRRLKNFEVFTQKTFLGIQRGNSYISTNQNNVFNLIALNTQGVPIASKARAQIIKYKWQTVLERDGGRLNYVSRKQEEVLKEEEIQLAASNTTYSFLPNTTGDYELRLYLPNSSNYVAHRFYAYGYGTSNTAFEVDKDGQIDITFDKESYKVGEQAKVLFTTPFNGRMLITVEQDKVLNHFYLDTQDKTASTTINLNQQHLPNVYVSATLIKPISDGAIPLTVAHGFESLSVEEPQSKLALSISAVEKSESKKKQSIKVKTNRAEAGIEVTLAVVDEGILQLKNYKSPKPHDFFFQKRALSVNAFDLYPRLFPEISIGRTSTGGGGALAELSDRANPFTNRRVKPVRFWSGVLKTDANGEVNYTIDIPQFSGSLRIMAVAYKDGAFGSAEREMKVADPIVISTGLPRFLSPGDKVKVPVTLSNTTNTDSKAKVQLEVSNNIKITGEKTKNITVKENQESQIEFEIQSAQVVDNAQITVLVSALGRTFSEELDITIRPVVGLVKKSGSGSIQAGMNQSIDLQHDFIPATTRAKLIISKSPLVQFTSSLDYLIQYPYGCVEQVTSSVFPQLYAQDLMKAIHPNKQNIALYESEIRSNVQEGIARLLARQNYSGGLSYWPGGGNANWFGTAYATHFLLEAQSLGYYVQPEAMNQLYNYLRDRVTRKKTEEYFYFANLTGERNRRKKQIAPKEAIYSLYVLTLAKKSDLATMNYYKENSNLLALDSKYLLAVSYLLMGDRASYQALLPRRFSGEYSEKVTNRSFHSYLRDEALALNALLEADPQNTQINEMARHLSEAFRKENGNNFNTQERAFALLALGKLAQKNNQNNVQGTIKMNGQLLANFSGEDIVLDNRLAGNAINIQANNEGILYYFWEMAGLSASGNIPEEDKKLKVRKTFYNRNGREIRNNTFRQNDLVVVKVSIVAEPYFRNIDNVVITDMLPAGFEIENPRLVPNQEFNWIRNRNTPEHFDIRDDRINYFTQVTGNVQNYYYLVRAVTKGTYKMGPVSADAMYDGSYHSYNGAGTVRILGQDENESQSN